MRWIILAIIVITLVYSLVYKSQQCGGLAANLSEFKCPPIYTCNINEKFPDAFGTCAFLPYIWIKSIITVPTSTPANENIDVCSCDQDIVIESKCAPIHNAICIDKSICKCE